MLICSFSLKKRYSKNSDIIFLNDELIYTNDGEDFSYGNSFDLFKDFCSNNEDYKDNEPLQKMFSIDSNTIKTYSNDISASMSFVIRSGTYGVEAEMTDRITKKIKYRRTKDEADIKKFLCYIYIPVDFAEYKAKKGIIIFQSIASYGVKTITTNYMKEFCAKKGITLEIKSVSPNAFFDMLMEQGKISKITITKNCISKNLADNLFVATGQEKTTILNPSLTNVGIQKIKSLFSDKGSNREVELCEIFGDNIEDVSLTFNLNGRSRTMRLMSLDRLSIVEEIPKNIKEDIQIIEYMKNTAESYKEYLICN